MAFALKLRIAGAEPILRGREHMWSVVRGFGVGGTFTVSDVFGLCNAQRGTVWSFVSLLEKAGFVAKAGEGTRPGSVIYRLVKAPADLPPLGKSGVGTFGRQQRLMWATMRAPVTRNGFSARDLSVLASTAGAPVTLRAAQQYIRHLDRAGYLLDAGTDEASAKRWRLKPAMNTGPKAPSVLAADIMFDRNRREVVGETIAEEAKS